MTATLHENIIMLQCFGTSPIIMLVILCLTFFFDIKEHKVPKRIIFASDWLVS